MAIISSRHIDFGAVRVVMGVRKHKQTGICITYQSTSIQNDVTHANRHTQTLHRFVCLATPCLDPPNRFITLARHDRMQDAQLHVAIVISPRVS
jgi:hypothetical protein